MPKRDSLNSLLKKVDDFATVPVKKQHVPNEWLAQLKDIQEADPKDRLSGDLRKRYAALVKSKTLMCEIEFLSIKKGVIQQKEEIEGWIKTCSKLLPAASMETTLNTR